MIWWLASGCNLGELREDLEGLTNTLVAEGTVLGIAPPSDDRIDLSQVGYEPGAGATVFLADAKSVDELEEVLISGAEVTASDGATTATLTEETQTHAYLTPPGAGLAYTAGNTMTITAQVGETIGVGRIELPEGAGLAIQEQHDPNTALALDVTGKGYTGTLIVVFDTQTGDITYSNEPKDIRAIYDLTRGSTEVTSVTIPGDAFPGESVYAVGIAGLVHTTMDDFDDMNTLLSGLLAGQMEFAPVVTVPLP